MINKFINSYKLIKTRGFHVALNAIIRILYFTIKGIFINSNLILVNIYNFRMFLSLKDKGLSRSLLLFANRELDHKYLLEKLFSMLFIEGLIIVDVNKTIFFPFILLNLSFISQSISDQSDFNPFFNGYFSLAESYKDKTEACTRALVHVLLFSIFIGLPSLFLIRTLA